ncbi:MAG: spondin domain-containing protein, partial [Desulfobacterales bacterium]|nr:spondin domain-containing protein [Desulfobacterales bacterium]MDX2513124.1 spondin domain-containing protein [Desulfobacterales bacterium]
RILVAMMFSVVLSMSAICGNAFGADLSVELTNTSHGSFFTPLLITAHDGDTHLFEVAEPASVSLQAMAEGGDISGLSAEIGGADADTIENPAGGLLAPGDTAMTDLDTDITGNEYLSLVAMILPTNDGFVGLDSLKIPTQAGTYWYMLTAYDAGTEVNNELVAVDGGVPGTPGFPNPPPVGSTDSGGSNVIGTDPNTMVHIHRGILGDTNPTGGMSDIDSTKYRWLNPIAKLVITVN